MWLKRGPFIHNFNFKNKQYYCILNLDQCLKKLTHWWNWNRDMCDILPIITHVLCTCCGAYSSRLFSTCILYWKPVSIVLYSSYFASMLHILCECTARMERMWMCEPFDSARQKISGLGGISEVSTHYLALKSGFWNLNKCLKSGWSDPPDLPELISSRRT